MMKLSILAIILGSVFSVIQIFALAKPGSFRAAARRFSRSIPWGYALMLLATVWFLRNLRHENISDFAAYKPLMLAGFGAIGIGTCFYVRDFLAVRGLAVLLLLLAQLTLEVQRWSESPWKNVIAGWAYVWVIAGIWLTVSPWRLRDWIEWSTATEGRIRGLSSARLAFGAGVVALGVFSF